MAEYTSKYSDAQKIKFAAEEAYVKTIQGRKTEPIANVEEISFYEHPRSYIDVCNKFRKGNVKIIN